MLDAGFEPELMKIIEQIMKAGQDIKQDFEGLSGV